MFIVLLLWRATARGQTALGLCCVVRLMQVLFLLSFLFLVLGVVFPLPLTNGALHQESNLWQRVCFPRPVFIWVVANVIGLFLFSIPFQLMPLCVFVCCSLDIRNGHVVLFDPNTYFLDIKRLVLFYCLYHPVIVKGTHFLSIYINVSFIFCIFLTNVIEQT